MRDNQVPLQPKIQKDGNFPKMRVLFDNRKHLTTGTRPQSQRSSTLYICLLNPNLPKSAQILFTFFCMIWEDSGQRVQSPFLYTRLDDVPISLSTKNELLRTLHTAKFRRIQVGSQLKCQLRLGLMSAAQATIIETISLFFLDRHGSLLCTGIDTEFGMT